MWNSGLYAVTGYIGGWNVLGEILGLIWILGLAVAMIAWFTLPPRRSNPRRLGGRITPSDDPMVHHGGD